MEEDSTEKQDERVKEDSAAEKDGNVEEDNEKAGEDDDVEEDGAADQDYEVKEESAAEDAEKAEEDNMEEDSAYGVTMMGNVSTLSSRWRPRRFPARPTTAKTGWRHMMHSWPMGRPTYLWMIVIHVWVQPIGTGTCGGMGSSKGSTLIHAYASREPIAVPGSGVVSVIVYCLGKYICV